MYVDVTNGRDGAITVRLREAQDTSRLHVQTSLPTNADLAAALRTSGAGWADDEAAWLAVEYLRSAQPPDDKDWPTAFDHMLDFASTHGWTSDDGRHMRAHVVRPDEAR